MCEPVIIGNATLYLGDCRDILPTLGKVDAVVTDPPYGLANKLQGGTWGKKFGGPDYDWDARPACLRFLPNVPTVAWGGNYFQVPPSRCWLVWYKRDAVPTMADCELAWTNIDGNAQVIDWTIAATNAERAGHPTQKPVAVMRRSIEVISPAKVILDPYMGSGSTGVAAVQMGRKFIGIERELKYFNIACRRIEEVQRQADLFITPEPQTKAKQGSLL
jgi:site-specific DNA-methyltransferase (adenine-specific)